MPNQTDIQEKTLQELKIGLVAAALELFETGLVLPGEGNISVRLPGEAAMIITPTANRYRNLVPEDLVVVGLDGVVDQARSGSRGPSSEYRMHAAMYLLRPRVQAVVHAHPPEAVAHAVLGKGIPMIVEETAIMLGGPIPCAPYSRTGTQDLVNAVTGNIGRGNAVLLGNHGLLTCGRSLTEAVDAVLVVEKLAGIHRLAASMADGPIAALQEVHHRVLSQIFNERFATY